MNFAYQLILSMSEIALPVGFVLLARRVHIAVPKIRIRTGEISAQRASLSDSAPTATADEIAMQFLITNGIAAADPLAARKTAHSFGLIYHSNLAQQRLAMKNGRIWVLEGCAASMHRQLLSCTPESGLMLSHLISAGVEVVFGQRH